MTYSELYLKNNNKIPTVLAFIFIILIFILFFKIFSNSSIPSKASKIELKRIEITNLTPNQVTVFWQTDQKEAGWLIYGQKGGKIDIIAYDDRDIPENKTPYIFHFVTIKNLFANTSYQFKLISRDALLTSSSVFTFTTPKNYRMFSNTQPAYGKIIKSNNLPLENGIVIVQIQNGFSLTGLTKATGEWLIPLYAVYQKDTLQQKQLTQDQALSIEVYSEAGQTSRIEASVKNVSPITDTIVIGSNYSFIDKESVLGVQNSNITLKTYKPLEIIFPKENSTIPGFIPLIKGNADPGLDILITIQGNNRTFAEKTRSNADRHWEVRMKDPMIVGKYLLTAEARKNDQLVASETRTFLMVANEGNDAKVLGVASAAPTIIRPSPIPTKVEITQDSSSSAKPSPPVTGSNQLAPAIGGISLLLLGLGIMLAF